MSKLPNTGTTIFTIMSNMAHDYDAINLSQGFPDFSAPTELLELINQHMLAGHNQYAPMPGLPKLREQIALKVDALYGRNMNPETEITVTSGGTEALFSAIEAFVHPGDEVIVFDPAYDSYDPAIRLAGGRPVHLPLMAPDFSVDWKQVAGALSPRTRMIILNTPHNPTGAVLGSDDLKTLAEIVRDTDIILLSDEVYEHIIFDGRRHESLHYYPDLADRSLIVSSFGKTYHATGWKIGYCVAPAPLMLEFRRVHQFVQFCVVTPMQFALADYMESNPEHCHQLAGFYQEKRDHFARLLDGSRFRLTPSAGTYFQLADYSEISGNEDTEFTRWMTTEKGVATIPISVFYESSPEQHYIRFCFAKNESTLEQAAALLCKI
jgi:methionine aminotransferase